MDSNLPLQALEMALAGRKTRSWVDSPFRSRAAIVQFCLCQPTAECWHSDQYVHTWPTRLSNARMESFFCDCEMSGGRMLDVYDLSTGRRRSKSMCWHAR